MISRALKEGFSGVSRHWAMSISSAIAVAITLTIISLFLIFTTHLQTFTRNVESSMEIAVLVDFDYESEEQEKKIEESIKAIDGVSSVKYSSKEDEFNYYIEQYDDEETKAVFEPFRDDNPMHDAYYVEAASGDQIRTVAEEIRKIEGVSEVNYGGQSTIDMVAAMINIRRFGGIFVLALGVLAVFLIQNTIKLTIYARQDEIDIMRNVGATNGFIRAPFVWEGVITGILGAILPILLTIYGYKFAYNLVHGVMFSSMFKMIAPVPYIYYISAVLLGIGILVGLIGSWLSVTRYLRETK